MKTGERIAVIYGASALGAAAISFFRGRRGAEVLFDMSLHGVVVGTVINGVVYYFLPSEQGGGVVAQPALTNGAVPEEFDEESAEEEAEKNSLFGHKEPKDYATVGSLPHKAVNLLSTVNAEKLYTPMKKAGVKIAALPSDPNLVNQDDT